MRVMAKFEIGGQFLDVLSRHVQETKHYQYRPDFPLTFSASSEDEIWPFPGFGHSRSDDRRHIEHPFLRAVVREYLVVEQNLGRFHISEQGVFRGEEKRVKTMFIEFERGDRFSPDWKPLTQLNRGRTNRDILESLLRRASDQAS